MMLLPKCCQYFTRKIIAMTDLSEVELQRVFDLKTKNRKKGLDGNEKDELMSLLYKAGQVSENDYQEYKSGRNIDQILRYALIAAGLFLLVSALKGSK